MSDFIDAVDNLDCFDPDDLPEPRDILTGECVTLPNNNAAVCLEVLNLCIDALEQRGKDLAVPRTSDECNQIWVAEVERFIMFMQGNFPLEIMALGIITIRNTFIMPSSDIAPAHHMLKIMAETPELYE